MTVNFIVSGEVHYFCEVHFVLVPASEFNKLELMSIELTAAWLAQVVIVINRLLKLHFTTHGSLNAFHRPFTWKPWLKSPYLRTLSQNEKYINLDLKQSTVELPVLWSGCVPWVDASHRVNLDLLFCCGPNCPGKWLCPVMFCHVNFVNFSQIPTVTCIFLDSKSLMSQFFGFFPFTRIAISL